MSAIFDTMIGIEIDTIPNYLDGTSASGFSQTEIFAPAYYEIGVTMPQMYYEDFQPIEAELLQMEHGVYPLNSGIPHNHCPPYATITNKTLNANAAIGSNNIAIAGFTSNQVNAIKAGYYIQLAGSQKVYQAKANVNANVSGVATVTLNSPLLSPSDPAMIAFGLAHAATTPIRFGNNVIFHLKMSKRAKWNTIPGFYRPLYSFSDQIVFREIITKMAPIGQEALFHESWS